MVNPLEAGAKVLSDAITSIADLLVFSVLKVIDHYCVFIVKIIVTIVGSIVNTLISQSDILSTE